MYFEGFCCVWDFLQSWLLVRELEKVELFVILNINAEFTEYWFLG